VVKTGERERERERRGRREKGGEGERRRTEETERRKERDSLTRLSGGVMIPPYDHYDVMAGQGTVALEMLQQVRTQNKTGDRFDKYV
jgi:threonine dehydratase